MLAIEFQNPLVSCEAVERAVESSAVVSSSSSQSSSSVVSSGLADEVEVGAVEEVDEEVEEAETDVDVAAGREALRSGGRSSSSGVAEVVAAAEAVELADLSPVVDVGAADVTAGAVGKLLCADLVEEVGCMLNDDGRAEEAASSLCCERMSAICAGTMIVMEM